MAKKQFLIGTLLFLIFAVACSTVSGIKEKLPQPATPTAIPSLKTSFKVGARGEYEIPFDVPRGTLIEYSFTVNNSINFKILDPRGNILASSSRVLADQGRVRADDLGRYTIVFDNGFSFFTSKTVNLIYRVIPPGGR